MVRVVAVASGFAGAVTLRLVVDGSVTGPAQSGEVGSFAWQTPTEAGECVLRVVATASHGDVVQSDRVKVKVKVTDSGMNDLWWGAFYSATESLEVAAEQAVRGSEAGYQVYVLNTLDYASLGEAGEEWWVVCAGMYATEDEAEAAAALLTADGSSGAYAKEVY